MHEFGLVMYNDPYLREHQTSSPISVSSTMFHEREEEQQQGTPEVSLTQLEDNQRATRKLCCRTVVGAPGAVQHSWIDREPARDDSTRDSDGLGVIGWCRYHLQGCLLPSGYLQRTADSNTSAWALVPEVARIFGDRNQQQEEDDEILPTNCTSWLLCGMAEFSLVYLYN